MWNALAEPSAAAQSAVLPQRDGEAVSGLIQRVLAVDLSGSHLKKTRMAWREGPAYSSRERVMEKEHAVVYGESNQRQEAREQFIAAMLEGRTFREVSAESSPPVKRAMAYRLLRAVRTRGTTALQDGRHGHPSKLRGEARAFLEACCRDAPCTPSPTLQAALRERFDLQVSVSQINRVRAALGISNHAKRSPQEKKRAKQGLLRSRPEWQEGAGSLLLLAAAQETELLSRLETALTSNLSTSDPSLRVAQSQPATLRCSLAHTPLPAGCRTPDEPGICAGYTGQALALLTGRHRAYGYRHTERFLAELACVGADAFSHRSARTLDSFALGAKATGEREPCSCLLR